jgi:putative membrane protein
MQVASSSSLFAIRASELATEMSASGSTLAAAQSIIRDQGGVASQLNYAGRRLELLPTAALSAEQSAELDRLRMSSNFDSDYRRAVGGALSRAYDAHRAFAQSGSSPTLIPVARMAAPVTKKNFDSLNR